jgi:hypothetical protein
MVPNGIAQYEVVVELLKFLVKKLPEVAMVSLKG